MSYKRVLNTEETIECMKVLNMLILENKLHYAETIGYIDYYADEEGNIYSISPNLYQCRKIHLVPDKWGYLGFTAYGEKNKPYPVRYLAHKLVAKAFHGAPPINTKLDVDHLNGNKMDNRPENLEWVTHQVNCQRGQDRKKQRKLNLNKEEL